MADIEARYRIKISQVRIQTKPVCKTLLKINLGLASLLTESKKNVGKTVLESKSQK